MKYLKEVILFLMVVSWLCQVKLVKYINFSKQKWQINEIHGDTPMKLSMDAILGGNFTHHHLGIQKEKKSVFKWYYVNANIALFSLPCVWLFSCKDLSLALWRYMEGWESSKNLPFVFFCVNQAFLVLSFLCKTKTASRNALILFLI